MFQLAQYVFGVGRVSSSTNNIENNQLKQDNVDNNTKTNSAAADSAKKKNKQDKDSCLLTNIENDWILVDVDENNDNVKSTKLNKQQQKSSSSTTNQLESSSTSKANKQQQKSSTKVIQTTKTANTKSSSNSTNNLSGQQQQQPKPNPSEQWLVDPPECFKSKAKNKKSGNGSKNQPTPQNSIDEQSSSEMENLLIEHPSMSVFDQLFVKKPITPVNNNKKATTTAATLANINVPLAELSKSEQRKVIMAKIQMSNNNKKKENEGGNGKENKTNNSKKLKASSSSVQTVTTPLAALNGNTQNGNKNALASIVSGKVLAINEKRLKAKNNSSKGQHKRQNKSLQQQNKNGPIRRQIKMFTHINGIYHNRNAC